MVVLVAVTVEVEVTVDVKVVEVVTACPADSWNRHNHKRKFKRILTAEEAISVSQTATGTVPPDSSAFGLFIDSVFFLIRSKVLCISIPTVISRLDELFHD